MRCFTSEETVKHGPEQAWPAVQRDPELRAHAIEVHGDKVDQWSDIKQVLERREAERHQAEALTGAISGLVKASARMADTLTRQAASRRIVDKALTPQAQAIERELQQQRNRGR